MKKHSHLVPSVALLTQLLLPLFFLFSCTQEETTLGLDFQDPNTLYHGTRATAPLSAWTFADDSLSTVGYAAGVFGNATYPGLANVEAVLYSQISIANTTGIALGDEVVIDSVVMTLVLDSLYPALPDSTVRPLHIIVRQLAEPIQSDSNYRASNSIADGDATLFDGTVNYSYGTDSLRLRLSPAAHDILKQTCSRDDFLQRTKGLSLRLAPDAQTLLTVNLSATATRITMHYHTAASENLKYNFIINNGAIQFMHYAHDYSSSPLSPLNANATDSLDGTSRLYLLPLGGTKARLNVQPFLDTFRVNHPTATIHYAELLLPTAPEADTSRAVRITALKRLASGSSTYVTDANVLSNPYTYSGFDGYYHSDKGYYRLRITQHLQELLREGKDYGTELIIDARRATAFPAIINGTADSNPIRIEFIYTE